MKLIYFILLVLISSSFNHAQWTNQNPVPEGNHLWSTFFIDDNIGWIVGSNGFILKTTNSGSDWIPQNSGSTVTLKSVQFIDQSTGWICGTDGLILLTNDGGINWIESISGTNETLNDLHFVDYNTGYIVGNNETILKSNDGGINWVMQQTGSLYDLYSVDFVDSILGYAVGGRDSSNFLKTTDGGINWIKRTLTLNYTTTPMLNCVEFINSNTGWIGSEGQYLNHSGNISKTTDGGETWSSVMINRPVSPEEIGIHNQEDNPLDTQRGIRSIWFKDSLNGFAVGGSLDGWWRSIYTTTDAGNSWQKKYGYSEQTGLLSVALTNSGYGIAVGYHGVIYRTTNNGTTWSQLLSGIHSGYTGDWISSVFMQNENIGWAAGFRKGIWYYPIIMKTTDGGKVWETNKEFYNSPDKTTSDIFFVSENIGWATFYNKGSYKTTDGGNSWFLTDNPGNEKYFKNQDTGWSAYSPLGVFKSTNGGNLWTQKSTVSSNSIYFSDLNNGFAVGYNGSIIKSTDGGENWAAKISGTIEELNKVHFYNNNNGICVGANGTVLITTDGGENWNATNTGSVSGLTSVIFTNPNTIWITGTHGTILNSTDLGNSWISYPGITSNNLSSVSFIDENSGWFAGSNGTILKYENGTVPVELISFEANILDQSVNLIWKTATELNNYGFDLERKSKNYDWTKIAFIEGQGNSTSVKSYSFADDLLVNESRVIYRLKQLDYNGEFHYSNNIEIDMTPSQFNLLQNYPNPFNPSTTIRYQLPKESNVVIKIFNILGAEVFEILNEKKAAGNHEVVLNAENLASGTYIYRLITNDFTMSKKMIVLK
ncbi:MAG: T9SS type A sorting domain-containing protein [Ignavibacteriaceae bacterium]|nr:T9SS type A sorting domain-containing protein [Ignavibacteriaceae bacterium]